MPAANAIERLRGNSIGAELFRGALGSFVVQVTGTGLGFLVQVCLARWLGRIGFGDFVIATAWLSMFVLIGKLGFDTGALRFVASYDGSQQLGRLRAFLTRSHQIVLAGSGCLSLLAALTVVLLGDQLRADLRATLLVAWLVAPAMALLEVASACLRGLRKVVTAQIPARVVRPLLLLVGVGLLITVGQGTLTPAMAMAVNLGAVLVSLALVGVGIWRYAPVGTFRTAPEYDTAAWCRVAAPLLLISGMHLVLGQTDLVMLGAFRGSAETAVYGAAVRTAGLVAFGLIAVNMVAAPLIADLHARGQTAELQRAVRLAAWGILAFAVPVSVAMIVGGSLILRLFGPDYTDGYLPLVILLGGRLISSLTGSVGFLMSMTGHQRQAAMILSVTAILNVIMNATLIPWIGAVGAATATACTTVLSNIAMLAYVRRTLHINPTILPMGSA